MSTTVFLHLGDVTIRLTTNYPLYARYLQSHFSRAVFSESAKSHIEVNLQWEKSPTKITSKTDDLLIGGNTSWSNHAVSTIRKISKKRKVLFNFKLDDLILKVSASQHFKFFKDHFRYTLMKAPQESHFFDLTYRMVYYPYFWYLEHFYETHPLHASSVKVGEKAVVINGLEGTGKTTLSLLLTRLLKGTLLCDNLTFYNKAKIYPCYEPIRLHKNTDPKIWEGIVAKIDGVKSSKDFYEPLAPEEGKGTVPAVFLLVCFHKEFFMRPMTSEVMQHKILNYSPLTAELGDYAEYASLMNLLVTQNNLPSQRQEILAAILQKTPCYEIGMDRSLGPQKNAEMIAERLKKEQIV